MTSNSKTDALFAKQGLIKTTLLDRAYCAQVRFFYDAERAFFAQCESWARAERVLDVGTGNGFYIQRLAKEYPDKQITAIDIDPEQLKIARATNSTQVEFADMPLSDVTDTYDAVCMRFVAQHLPDLTKALIRLRSLLDKNGVVYITEGDETLTCFEPEPKAFRYLFKKLAEQRNMIGADLNVAANIAKIAESAGYTVNKTYEARAATDAQGGLDKMAEMEWSIFAYLKFIDVVDIDYDEVVADLRSWHTSDSAFGTETVKIFTLSPTL